MCSSDLPCTIRRSGVSSRAVAMKISRRDVVAGGAVVAATAAGLGRRLEAADAAGMKGHVRHSVCKWCYPKVSLKDLAEAGREIGLGSIELLEVREIPVVQKLGLTCAMVSGIPGGITKGLNRRQNHAAIQEWFEATDRKSTRLNSSH